MSCTLRQSCCLTLHLPSSAKGPGDAASPAAKHLCSTGLGLVLAPSHYQTKPKTKEQTHRETYRRKGELHSTTQAWWCTATIPARGLNQRVVWLRPAWATWQLVPSARAHTQRETDRDTETEHAFRRNRIPAGIQTVTGASGCIKKCTGVLASAAHIIKLEQCGEY